MSINDAEKLSVVPEVFYDLISRVPAGIIILLTAYAFLPHCQIPHVLRNISSTSLETVVIPILGFVLSYVLGLALSSISSPIILLLLDIPIWKWIKKNFRELSKLPKAEDILNVSDIKWKKRLRTRIRIYVFLRQEDTRIGLEMVKHQAETSLFANLTLGFLLLIPGFLFLNHICEQDCSKIGSIGYCTAIVLFSCSLIVAFFRNWAFWKHHISYAESILKNKP